jgi:hypothetical protein
VTQIGPIWDGGTAARSSEDAHSCLICRVIVGRRDREHCASITCMIRHYVARRAQVSEAHPHNADERTSVCSLRLYDIRCLALVCNPLAGTGSWVTVTHTVEYSVQEDVN